MHAPHTFEPRKEQESLIRSTKVRAHWTPHSEVSFRYLVSPVILAFVLGYLKEGDCLSTQKGDPVWRGSMQSAVAT